MPGQFTRKDCQKGIISLLALASISFLLISLVAITANTSNPNIRQLIESFAKNKKKKAKTCADIGNPKKRQACRAASDWNKQQALIQENESEVVPPAENMAAIPPQKQEEEPSTGIGGFTGMPPEPPAVTQTLPKQPTKDIAEIPYPRPKEPAVTQTLPKQPTKDIAEIPPQPQITSYNTKLIPYLRYLVRTRIQSLLDLIYKSKK
jgi:hypothetical protein